MKSGNLGRAKKGERWFIDESTDQVLASIDLALPRMEPPASLWARVQRDLEGGDRLAEGLVVDRIGEGRWRELAPGVRMKRLWNSRTMLIECQPGARVPAHVHSAFEHSIVLSGDLVSTLGVFGPGDYHGLPITDIHEGWTTRTGCLVLVQYDPA